MDALVGLQSALDEGSVVMQKCEIHSDLAVHLDHPLGTARFTYAVIKRRQVQAIALLTPAERIQGVPAFQVGYAVAKSARGCGLAKQTASHAIDELQNGLKRHGVKQFYVEAIVSQANAASNAVARQLFSDDPSTGVDEHSGEPIFQYTKLIK